MISAMSEIEDLERTVGYVSETKKGRGRPRGRKPRTACSNGHPLTENNIYRHKRWNGAYDVECRICRELRRARWRKKHPESSRTKRQQRADALAARLEAQGDHAGAAIVRSLVNPPKPR
jgi:hypothetical protein